MQRFNRFSFALLAVTLAVGCGGASTGPGTTSTTVTPTGLRSACPVAAPKAGASCAGSIECEYENASGKGTTIATCSAPTDGGSFEWSLNDTTPPANAAACPATFDAIASNGACPNVASTCHYDEGDCRCVCVDQGKSGWVCEKKAPIPATTASGSESAQQCPADRPLLGSACGAAFEGLTCVYTQVCGYFSFGPDMICQQGYWDETQVNASCGAPPTCTLPKG
jgi:hypothetical protein